MKRDVMSLLLDDLTAALKRQEDRIISLEKELLNLRKDRVTDNNSLNRFIFDTVAKLNALTKAQETLRLNSGRCIYVHQMPEVENI